MTTQDHSVPETSMKEGSRESTKLETYFAERLGAYVTKVAKEGHRRDEFAVEFRTEVNKYATSLGIAPEDVYSKFARTVLFDIPRFLEASVR